MTASSSSSLRDIEKLLEAALALADTANEPMMGVRIAEALDLIPERKFDPRLNP